MAEVDKKVNDEPDGSIDETDKSDDKVTGTDILSESSDRNMDVESPSSELESLANEHHDESDSGESMASGKEGMYVVNIEQETKHSVENKENENVVKEFKEGRTSVEPAEKKIKTDKVLPDGGGRLSDSRPASAASSGGKSSTPGKDKDPAKREKDKDREERIRQAQLRLAEERQKKIEEMREQQRLAQENREKQLEARRRKIEELKRREEERRKQVEERRRNQDEIDRAKKEAILNKAKERLTRYEQWKAHGRKGGRKHVLGFGSRTPREVCLPLDSRRSSSQSTLRRSPNSSDYDSYFHRRAVSASSVVRRHCCIDINKLTQGIGYPGESPPSKQLSVSTSVLYQKRSPDFSSTGTINKVGTGSFRSGAESLMASTPPSRHKSAINVATSGVTGVKMRDPSKMSPRKQRPYSVATSMPSFVPIEIDSPRPSRSKSTDRGIRDVSKTRTPGRKDDEKGDGKEKKAATLPRPKDRQKIEERRLEAEKKREERREREKEREKERIERMSKSETHEKEKQAVPKPLSKSFIERLSTPKHTSADKKETSEKEATPVKVIKKGSPVEAPSVPEKTSTTPKVKARPQRDSPSKSPSKSSLKDTKGKEDSSKSDSPKSISPVPSKTSQPQGTPTIQIEGAPDVEAEQIEKPEVADGTPDKQATEPTVKFVEPEAPKTSPRAKPEPKQVSPEPKAAKADSSTPKTDKEREMEEYKTKLAEKRRLAREKAEREAEIERIRQEELRRQEEEREREEEERQRREEEEALRLAEENRKAEEERLARAIEAEEKRKREEAERLERERIQKEEADRKAKEEAERLEKEKQEKARKEEEEKIERKKRLEEVLKRIKPDSPSSTPEKSRTESPTRVATTSSSGRTSLVSSEDEKGDDSEKEKPAEKIKVADETPKFKSPLLQKLTEGKTQDSDSGTPKFKSPLLQSIMGKTKLGARLSSTRLDEIGRSTEKLSSSTEGLSDEEKASSDKEDQTPLTASVVNGHGRIEIESQGETCDSEKELDTKSSIETKDEVIHGDKEEVVSDQSLVDSELDTVIVDTETQVKVHEDDFKVEPVTDSQITVASTGDSAVSLSFNGVSSHNGDLHIEPKELLDSRELVDSSISMRTADSFASSQTGSIGGSLVDSQNLPTSESTQFEEVIDLNLHVTNRTLKAQQLAENFINHNLNDNDDLTMSDSSDSPSHSVGKPIIAFEDNATRRQDVPDLLS